jgi:hypothetical protein
MKKILLIVTAIMIYSSVFASPNGNLKDSFSNKIQEDSSSLNFYDIQKLKLYPNPVSDYLFIEYDVILVKEAKLQIYNSIGAVVYTKILEERKDNIKISVSEYKNGLYFCSLKIDGKLLKTQKILINH